MQRQLPNETNKKVFDLNQRTNQQEMIIKLFFFSMYILRISFLIQHKEQVIFNLLNHNGSL